MIDDEDLEESWKVLERTRFEQQSPHTMNAAEAMERIVFALEDFYATTGGRITERPKVSIVPTTRLEDEDTLWKAWVEFRLTAVGSSSFESDPKTSIEAALEHLFHICLDAFRESLERHRGEADNLRAQAAKQERIARGIVGIMGSMGQYTPYQMNLPDETPSLPV